MFIVQWQHHPSILIHTHPVECTIQVRAFRKEFEGCSEEAIGLYSEGSVAKEDRMWPYIFQKVRDSPVHGPHMHVCENSANLNINIAQYVYMQGSRVSLSNMFITLRRGEWGTPLSLCSTSAPLSLSA